jgi:serine/threonine protein kinase
MEYFRLGDLHRYINSAEGASCAEQDAKAIAYQLLQGLNIMHAIGFAHRDLKPQVGKSSYCSLLWKWTGWVFQGR